MNNEFKKTTGKTQTVYTLESATAGGTSSGSIASVSSPMGGVRKRGDNLIAQESDKKKVPASTPRNFVAKNAKTSGAGVHRDKKKSEKQGNAKHKKPYMESLKDRFDSLKLKLSEAGYGRDSWDSNTSGWQDREQGSIDRDKRDFKRQELQHELGHERNNYAVAIDGRTWKVFADQRQAQNIARSLKAKGKNATVHETGASPTAEGVAEGVRGLYHGDKGIRPPQTQPERDEIARDIKQSRATNRADQTTTGYGNRVAPQGGAASSSTSGQIGAKKTDATGQTSYSSRNADKKYANYAGNINTTAGAGKGVAEGLPQTLRKVVPGHAKREIDKKMDAGKFGKTDADKDANFQRYKKIQDKLKEQGVAEGADPTSDSSQEARGDHRGEVKKNKDGSYVATNQAGSRKIFKSQKAAEAHANSGQQDVAEGLDTEQRARLKDLIDQYQDSTDPSDYQSYSDPEDILSDIRREFGDRIASQVEAGTDKMHFGRGDIHQRSDPLGWKTPVDRQTKAGKMYKQDSDYRKNTIKSRYSLSGKSAVEGVAEGDAYMESLDQMLERQLEPTMDLDAWNDNFQNADPQKYHQFKNKSPEKKK